MTFVFLAHLPILLLLQLLLLLQKNSQIHGAPSIVVISCVLYAVLMLRFIPVPSQTRDPATVFATIFGNHEGSFGYFVVPSIAKDFLWALTGTL